jgi:hypothetical protein
MASWYMDTEIHQDVRVLISDSGYINSNLALKYLHHLTLHTQAGQDRPPKVLLMDQHGSHITEEFIIKATDHNIRPFPFPSHLTHILQPRYVSVFQPYKHWHKQAIQHATRSLDIKYTIASFFQDLSHIREQTFKPTTIQGAFQRAGIWLINLQVALEKMKIYQPPSLSRKLDLPPQTLMKALHAEQSLVAIAHKLQQKDFFSSPTQR